jgi:hypothetical protein
VQVQASATSGFKPFQSKQGATGTSIFS